MTHAIRASLVLALTLSACSVGDEEEACVGMRRIALNRIALNRISLNELDANGLLEDAPSSTDDLRDPEMRDIFAYTVQCALPADQSVELTIDGEVVAFEGALGLAPEWRAGGCDSECQEWISACLIARVNAKGESVAISLRGDHPGLLPSADELATYDTVEATYFGNVFGDGKRMHACLPEGATSIPRVCGEAPDCLVQIEGPCSEVCDGSTCRAADGTVFSKTITVQRDTSACS